MSPGNFPEHFLSSPHSPLKQSSFCSQGNDGNLLKSFGFESIHFASSIGSSVFGAQTFPVGHSWNNEVKDSTLIQISFGRDDEH